MIMNLPQDSHSNTTASTSTANSSNRLTTFNKLSSHKVCKSSFAVPSKDNKDWSNLTIGGAAKYSEIQIQVNETDDEEILVCSSDEDSEEDQPHEPFIGNQYKTYVQRLDNRKLQYGEIKMFKMSQITVIPSKRTSDFSRTDEKPKPCILSLKGLKHDFLQIKKVITANNRPVVTQMPQSEKKRSTSSKSFHELSQQVVQTYPITIQEDRIDDTKQKPKIGMKKIQIATTRNKTSQLQLIPSEKISKITTQASKGQTMNKSIDVRVSRPSSNSQQYYITQDLASVVFDQATDKMEDIKPVISEAFAAKLSKLFK